MIQNSHRFRFKFKYLLFGILLGYIIICQSCMTMRMTPKETSRYFNDSKVAFQSETLQIGNHKLHYIETGKPEKPTLFFVHGSPGSWDAFKQYLSDTILLRKFRMIAVDRPGFGYSDFGNAEDLPTQSMLLEALIAATDNHRGIALVGHSIGGPVIVKIATEIPDKISQLVILAGSVDPRMENPENWRVVIKSKPLRYLIPGALRQSNDELWQFKKDLFTMEPQVKNITSNIVVIHGTKDPLVPYGNVAFINRSFTHAKSIHVIAIENANHFIPWEHYELIRNTLAALKL